MTWPLVAMSTGTTIGTSTMSKASISCWERVVRRAVVDDDDLEVRVAQRGHRLHRLDDPGALVVGRHQDGDPRRQRLGERLVVRREVDAPQVGPEVGHGQRGQGQEAGVDQHGVAMKNQPKVSPERARSSGSRLRHPSRACTASASAAYGDGEAARARGRAAEPEQGAGDRARVEVVGASRGTPRAGLATGR